MTAAVALTVAGSDPSGGAGIQADLKTFSALGVYGTAVLTALTAQNTRGVTGVHGVPPEFVAEQLATLFADVEVHATKLGMLGTADVVRAVAAALADRPAGPVVCDPVMVATSGDRLISVEAVDAVRADLLPVTVPEVRRLLATLAGLRPPRPEAVLHWSTWRRRHQQRARRAHRHRRTRGYPDEARL